MWCLSVIFFHLHIYWHSLAPLQMQIWWVSVQISSCWYTQSEKDDYLPLSSSDVAGIQNSSFAVADIKSWPLKCQDFRNWEQELFESLASNSRVWKWFVSPRLLFFENLCRLNFRYILLHFAEDNNKVWSSSEVMLWECVCVCVWAKLAMIL